ncbi:MAG: glycosyltransferase [Planctomycetota bacterium]
MDVLHVTHQFLPETQGGVESHVMELSLAQRALGLRPRVLCGSFMPWPKIGSESSFVEGIEVERVHRDDLYFDVFSKTWHPRLEDWIAQFLERRRPDVMHIHHWLRMSTNLVEIARRASIPVVVSLHDHWISCPRVFRMRADDPACMRPLSPNACRDCVPRFGHETADEIDESIAVFHSEFRSELELAQSVLVATDSLGDRLAATSSIPRDRFRTLPLCYARRFAGLPRLPEPSPERPRRFAFWGGLGAHKGPTLLLDAMRAVVARAPGRAELHILGSSGVDSIDAALRAQARDLPITFHGKFVPTDVHRLAPDVGVFPSTCLETWSFVLDECIELRRPAIVTDLAAPAERLGRGGLTIRPNAAALADAMCSMLEHHAWQTYADALPSLPRTADEYAGALKSPYADAVRLAPSRPITANVIAERAAVRTRFLHRQRESALGRVIPHGGPR